jgi:hypothetical protein
MSWTERECVECGTYVSFGIYYSEHEHDDTEISVTVKCGYCVNGTTEEEEQEQKKSEEMNMQKFQEQDLINTVDISHLDDAVKEALELTREFYNSSPEVFKMQYLRAFYYIWKSTC